MGLKFGFVTVKEEIEFCRLSQMTKCNEDRLVKLYLAEYEGYNEFYRTLKMLMQEDNEPEIYEPKDRMIYVDEDSTPESYYIIWKLELLLRVRSNDSSIEDKFREIEYVWGYLGHPKDLWEYIYYGPTTPYESRYENFLTYLENELKRIQNIGLYSQESFWKKLLRSLTSSIHWAEDRG